MTDVLLRAAIYCRISLAKMKDQTKVDRQERICCRLADEAAQKLGRRIEIVDVFKDNSRSAWQRNRKRPDWDRMVTGIEAGSYDLIISYHGDRLMRQPWDLEYLLRKAEEQGLKLISPNSEYDLDNYEDRYRLRGEVNAACRESDRLSARRKDALKDLAEHEGRGSSGGVRPYGFEVDRNTVRHAEAVIIAEAGYRVLGGERVSSVCRDLNDRGVTASLGGEWNPGVLKRVLLRARNAGLVEHHGRLHKAAWEPIMPRADWEAICSLLQTRAAEFPSGPRPRRYWLSGIAECPTGHPMKIKRQGGRTAVAYWCPVTGCPTSVLRNRDHVDAFVLGAVLQRLSDPGLLRELESLEVASARNGANVAIQLQNLTRRRKEIVRDFTKSAVLTTADLEDAVAEVDNEMARLRAQLDSVRQAHVLHGVAGVDRATWDRLPLDRRRAVARALFRIVVLPTGRRGPGFDPATVRLQRLV